MMSDRIEKSDAEWRADPAISGHPPSRHRTRFTGSLNKVYDEGMYHCVCCDGGLFSSATKYDSGSGWPSYDTLAMMQCRN